MDFIKDIPAKTAVAHTTGDIVINIESKLAFVMIHTPEKSYNRSVSLDALMAEMTATQKTTVRKFIKAILAQAVEVDITDVPEVLTE